MVAFAALRRRAGWIFLAGVAVVAFLVRLVPVLAGGGLGFFGRYDDGGTTPPPTPSPSVECRTGISCFSTHRGSSSS